VTARMYERTVLRFLPDGGFMKYACHQRMIEHDGELVPAGPESRELAAVYDADGNQVSLRAQAAA
jgi:hypothetical protein